MRGWLKDMRLSAGLSQDEMAMRLSISQPFYCEIERGTRQKDMTYSMMEKLSNALGCSVHAIIEAEKATKSTRQELAALYGCTIDELLSPTQPTANKTSPSERPAGEYSIFREPEQPPAE